MPAPDFKTVPDELLHHASALVEHLEDEGFDVKVEEPGFGFPFTPTVVAQRGHETLIIELATELSTSRVSRWVKFCRSQSDDTRFAVCLSYESALAAKTTEFSQAHRIGVLAFQDHGVSEIRAPLDLAIHVDLPDRRDIAPKIRRLVAAPFAKIERGEWRDGLNDLYLEIEEKARTYLVEGIQRTRIVSLDKKGNPVEPERVERMTMGQLAFAFKNIANQNQKDSLIGSTLEFINPTRVLLTHKRLQREAEADIRRNVGKHAWTAMTCLTEIVS